MAGGFSQSLSFANAGSYNADGTQQWGLDALTKSASANVKSAWFSLGTLKSDASALFVRFVYLNNSGSDTGVQHDLGIGASGSQIVLIPNINQGQPSGTPQTNIVVFQHIIPIAVPEGTQVWARTSVNVASSTPSVGASFTPVDAAFGSNWDFAGVDCIGSTGVGTGTVMACGSGVKGTYVQLTAQTIRDYVGFFLCYDFAGVTGPTKAIIDIAIGASGSTIIAPNLIAAPQIGWAALDMNFIPVEIKEGSQIWARACALDLSTNNLGVTLYGVF